MNDVKYSSFNITGNKASGIQFISLAVLLIISIQCNVLSGTDQIIDTNRIYGVTVDNVNRIGNITTSLSSLRFKPTTRVVFDEWQPASGYLNPVTQIHTSSFVMGEILDSYYMSQYTTEQFTERTIEYMNVLDKNVDIWEIGNEVNGEWLGTSQSVIEKLYYAFKIGYKRNKKMAVTLYYNKNCWSNPQNEMFRWVLSNMPAKMRVMLDYVFVSYYEDDCNNLQPNWQQVFDSLHTIFPNSKLGIGECGTTIAANKETYINRYYRMNITTPSYVGGYYWWYYKQDCVPYSKPLWTVLNNALTNGQSFASENKSMINNFQSNNSFNLSNYPNPFNPVTKIRFNIPQATTGNVKTKLTIYDETGREATTLINEDLNTGMHEIVWNAESYSSGIYFAKILCGEFSETRKLLLIK